MEIKSIKHIRYRRLLFSVSENMLADSPIIDSAINYFIQVPANYKGMLKEFPTILLGLSHGESDIRNGIYHRTLDEINSFIKNQKYEYGFLFPVTSELNQFIGLYNSFARAKGIRKAEAFRLKAYANENILAITYLKQNQEYMCVNFYRVTTERAVNIYSFSLKHEGVQQYSSSHYGRAHKALHWLDILEFKRRGVKTYDFCGWYNGQEDQNLLGINKFKEQFGGKVVMEYSGVIYRNPILRLLKNMLGND